MASSVSEQGWRALVLGLTFLFAAPEVPAKAVRVAPEDAARSLGHGGPWGQLSTVAWLLHLGQLKGSCSSLLLSSEVLPDGDEGGRQGLSRTAGDLTSTVSKGLACHFGILIGVGGSQRGVGTPFLFLF